MLDHEPSSQEQRALACTHCADIRASNQAWAGDDGFTYEPISPVDQHWRGHVPMNIHHQLYALATGEGWVLSLDEVQEIAAWQPQYVALVPPPVCGCLVAGPCYTHQAEANRKWRIQHDLEVEHNEHEAAIDSQRSLVLRRFEQLLDHTEHHEAARCTARAKRTGQQCRRLANPGKTKCRVHGGNSTGPRTPEGKARIAEYQRQRHARARQAKLQAN